MLIGKTGLPTIYLSWCGKLATLVRMVTLPLFAAAFMLLTWEVACRVYAIKPVIMPAPSLVLKRLLDSWDILLENAVPTVVETVAAFVIAVLSGMLLSLVMLYSRIVREVLYPNLVLFQLIPKIAVAPLFILWLGIDWESRLAIAVFVAFFPIVIATSSGMNAVDDSLLRLCRSLNASEWQIFSSVRLPVALPYLFGGMKICMTLAIIGVIVGEFITSQRGLGYLILFAGSKMETALVMAAILVLCIAGLLLYAIVAATEWLVMQRYG